FDPDGQVVRSTSTNGSQSQETTGQGDGATATANIPGDDAPVANPIGSTRAENTETTNYEISNTTTTTVKEPGEVKKLSVSVAIDGKYTPAADGTGEPTYAARSAEEVQQIRALVAAAAGTDEARGDKLEVVNVRFNREPSAAPGEAQGSSLFAFDKNDIMRGVELLVLVITGFMLIFFVVRPLLKTATGRGGVPAVIGPDGVPV